MDKNSSNLEARPLARHFLSKALRRERGLFLSYLEKTLRILLLNALKTPDGNLYHGGLFSLFRNKIRHAP